VSDLEDAEDILQDVYYELTETSRLSVPIGQVASWLFRVARNKIIDRYRKKKTERLDDMKLPGQQVEDEHYLLSDLIQSTQDSPGDAFDQSLMWLAIEEALEELPKEQRDVFEMHEIEGRSFNEISAATGVSINTLLSRKRYAVLHLRKRLIHLYNELFN
jgi:RNA polymerase sigma factor (sigma-70 family)